MPEVVRITELGSFVQRTLLAINEGVSGARENGIVADLPDEVNFQCVVIDQWQALDALTTTTGTSETTQGGGSTTTTTDNQSSTRRNENSNAHNQTDEETITEES